MAMTFKLFILGRINMITYIYRYENRLAAWTAQMKKCIYIYLFELITICSDDLRICTNK